jgi:hypothetical protein
MGPRQGENDSTEPRRGCDEAAEGFGDAAAIVVTLADRQAGGVFWGVVFRLARRRRRRVAGDDAEVTDELGFRGEGRVRRRSDCLRRRVEDEEDSGTGTQR